MLLGSKPASRCLGLELTGAKVAAHNHIWAFSSNLSFSVLEDRDFFGGSIKSAQLVKLFPIYELEALECTLQSPIHNTFYSYKCLGIEIITGELLSDLVISLQTSHCWLDVSWPQKNPHCIKTWRDTVLRPHLIRCMVRVCLMSRPWALLQRSEERGHFSRLNNSRTVLCDWRTPSSTSLHILMRWWIPLSRLPSGLFLVERTSSAFAKPVCAFCSLCSAKGLRKRCLLLVPLQILIGIWHLDSTIRAAW